MTAAPATSRPPSAGNEVSAVRAGLEIRHAYLRLKLVEVELHWAAEALASGFIPPATAIAMLDDAMGALWEGGGP